MTATNRAYPLARAVASAMVTSVGVEDPNTIGSRALWEAVLAGGSRTMAQEHDKMKRPGIARRRVGAGRAKACLLVLALVTGDLAAGDAPATAPAAGSVTLTVEVVGLESARGQVRIAVFASEKTWLKTAAYSTVLDLEDTTCRWSVDVSSLEDYGVVILHDLNKNGKNDRNLLGIPKEPYGFSNNVRAAFGPPKWSKARFTVASGDTEIRVEVK